MAPVKATGKAASNLLGQKFGERKDSVTNKGAPAATPANPATAAAKKAAADKSMRMDAL